MAARRLRGLLRAAAWTALLTAVGAFVVLLVGSGRDDDFEQVDLGSGEVSVADAIAVAGIDPLTVRGYVFVGAGYDFLRLCHARRGDDPPECIGPFLILEGIDPGGFELLDGETEFGPVRYSPRDVALVGTIVGTGMQVSYVLGEE